jgi:hypothetical protein
MGFIAPDTATAHELREPPGQACDPCRFAILLDRATAAAACGGKAAPAKPCSRTSRQSAIAFSQPSAIRLSM